MKRTVLITAAIVALGAGGALAAGDAEAGKAKSIICAACHGAKGEGNPKITPPPAPLAGKTEAQLAQAMQDYKSGKKDNAGMKAMLATMNDQDIANLAAYYATFK